MHPRQFLYNAANRLTIWAIRVGIPRPPYTRETALIVETVGRRSGKRPQVPVAYLEERGELIVVVENSLRAQWVQNALAQDGQLRIFLRGRWCHARLRMLEGDPEAYLHRMNRLHAALLRGHSTTLGFAAIKPEELKELRGQVCC